MLLCAGRTEAPNSATSARRSVRAPAHLFACGAIERVGEEQPKNGRAIGAAPMSLISFLAGRRIRAPLPAAICNLCARLCAPRSDSFRAGRCRTACAGAKQQGTVTWTHPPMGSFWPPRRRRSRRDIPLPCALRINLVAVVVHFFELFAAHPRPARADTTGAGRYRRYAG